MAYKCIYDILIVLLILKLLTYSATQTKTHNENTKLLENIN